MCHEPSFARWHNGCSLEIRSDLRRREVVSKRFLIGLSLLGLSFVFGCQSGQQSNTANTNAETAETTRTGPDNSEITTSENNGTRTETRTFRGNSRISKVVVTTKNGQ